MLGFLRDGPMATHHREGSSRDQDYHRTLMGQQPNIELEISDLPRPTGHPGPPRRWSPQRPGELSSPADVPWGGAYGTTGPDAGYALRLLADRHLETVPGETLHNAKAAVAAVAAARASHVGRAPIRQDIDVAALLLGYDRDGVAQDIVSDLDAARPGWIANLGHDAAKERALVASIPLAVLSLHPDEIRTRLAGGESLLRP